MYAQSRAGSGLVRGAEKSLRALSLLGQAVIAVNAGPQSDSSAD